MQCEAVLDGEIVVLDATGRPQFYELLPRLGEPVFVGAFASGRPRRAGHCGELITLRGGQRIAGRYSRRFKIACVGHQMNSGKPIMTAHKYNPGETACCGLPPGP